MTVYFPAWEAVGVALGGGKHFNGVVEFCLQFDTSIVQFLLDAGPWGCSRHFFSPCSAPHLFWSVPQLPTPCPLTEQTQKHWKHTGTNTGNQAQSTRGTGRCGMLRCFLEHKIKPQCHLARKGMMMTKHHGPSVHVPLSKGNLVQRLWVSIYPTRNLNTLAQWTIFSAENQKLRNLGYLLCQEASCRTNGNTEFQERSDSSLNPLVKNSLETLA